MRVRLLRRVVINGIAYRAGLELFFHRDTAKRLVRKGLAERLDGQQHERKTA